MLHWIANTTGNTSEPWFSNISIYPTALINTTDSHTDNDVLPIVSLVAIAMFLVIIMILSGVGNALVLYIIARHLHMKTVTNLFIASLSVSDLLVTIACMPFTFGSIVRLKWIFGIEFCVFNGYLNCALAFVSTLTLACVSVDKLAMVKSPRPSTNTKNATWLVILVWTIAFVFSFPWYLFMPYVQRSSYYKSGFYHCMYIFHVTSSRVGAIYSVLVICICYLLAFAVMFHCFIRIWQTMRSTNQQVQPASLSASQVLFYAETRTATTVLIMIAVCAICRGPYLLMGLVAAATKTEFTVAMDTVALFLTWCNCAINPIVYVIRNPHIAQILHLGRQTGYRAQSFSTIHPSPFHAKPENQNGTTPNGAVATPDGINIISIERTSSASALSLTFLVPRKGSETPSMLTCNTATTNV